MNTEFIYLQVMKLVEKNINSPLTSSCGRLFDAVASILNLTQENSYHSEAPIALESLVNPDKFGLYNYKITFDKFYSIDTTLIIQDIFKDLKNGAPKEEISSKFHYTLSHATVSMLKKLKKETGIKKVCLSGGVFCNEYLTNIIKNLGEENGLTIYTQQKVSPNDNGLSYGQAVIGAAQLED